MATDSPPKHHSLAVVDMARFTQSELLSLSLCLHSPLDQRDVLIPEINRSIFNESAATPRQTYSEIRPCNRRKRPSEKSLVREARIESGDYERDENRLILRLLKDLIKTSPLHDPSEEERMRCFDEETLDCDCGGGDGKTKRKRRIFEKAVVDDDIVNTNGVVVDLVALKNVLDPYGEELKRRTAGLLSEEECLGFLRGLDGEWVSRRRKRRTVDACEFGDHLPVKWKLLLALRRREGRIWLYCRRYISPRGQEFVSCKDVALYLQSLFGGSNDPLVDVHMDNIQYHAGTLFKEGHLGKNNIPVAALRTSSVNDEQGSEVALLGIDQLLDVQVSILFECHQCKLVFHEKKLYLQHVFSSHEKTTRRYRLGSRVRNGVILDSGQYECQFCYRIFQGKDSYSRHVGVHVKGYNNDSLDRRCAGTNAELITSSNNGLDKPFSKTGDASVVNLPNHLLSTSTTMDNKEYHGGLPLTKANVAASDGNLCYELVSNSRATPGVEFPISRDEILKHVSETEDVENDLRNQLKFKGNNILVTGIYSDYSLTAYPLGNMLPLADNFKQPAARHSKVSKSQIQEALSGKYEKCTRETICPAHRLNSEHRISVGKEIDYNGGNLRLSVQSLDVMETNTDTHKKQSSEQNGVISAEIESSGDFGQSGSMMHNSDHLTGINYISCQGEEVSSFKQKLESVAEFKLEYSVQTVDELETNADSMKQNLQRNVVTAGDNVSIGDVGRSRSMEQPTDHLTGFSSTTFGGEELSNIRHKLDSDAEFELEHDLQTLDDLETNTDTHMNQNQDQNVMDSGEIVSTGNVGKLGSMVQPSVRLTETSSTPCEGKGQQLENVTEFEELKLDNMEHLKLSFPIMEGSLCTPVTSMDNENDAEVNDFDSTQIDLEDILSSLECRRQFSAVCVWCTSEFIYEVVNSEFLAESVGYMCTKCRSKISAQFNASTMVYP
ncbi:hypothetical protein QQ045_009533 [Rhodiola kirilowii]